MSVKQQEFNYKFIKENASAGSWRRGYEYHLKDMVFDSYPEKNFYMAKVKGNFPHSTKKKKKNFFNENRERKKFFFFYFFFFFLFF